MRPSLLTILIVGIVVVLGLGLSRSPALRRASRVVSFIGLTVFGLVAAASLYGMVALADRGGGVLILLAMPTGFIAWLFFNTFTAAREYEDLQSLPVGERIAHTNALLESQLREHERTIAENSEKVNSFWITPGKRKRLREEIAHSRMLIRGLTAVRPGVNDPNSYSDTTSPPRTNL